MTDKKTNTDKTKKTQRKNSYRMRFTLPNGQMVQHTAHTKAERDSIRGWVDKLISSQRTGVANVEAEEWAQTRPKGALRDFLIKNGLLTDNADTERTIGDIVEHFAQRPVKEGTLKTYAQVGKDLISCFGEHKRLRDLTPLDGSRFEQYLQTAARRTTGGELTGAGLGKATVKKRIQRAKQLFLEAKRLQWIDSNPLEGIKGGNVANMERWFYVTKETALEAMAKTPNLEYRAMIALCRFAGARGVSEFNSLEWNSSWIRWSADGQPGTIRLHRTKTEDSGFADTILPMAPELESVLRDLFDNAEPGRVKLFTTRTNPGGRIKEQFLRIGVDIISPYNLRRSYCRDLMESGLDPKCYEYYSGHSLQTSLRFYQQWDNARAQKAMPKVLAALATEKKSDATFGATSTPQTPLLTPCDKPHQDETSGDKNAQTLENKALSQNKSPSCVLSQPGKLGAEGFEITSNDPYFYGISANAEISSTTFGATQNFIEQLLTVFDKLEAAEQEQLLKLLTARVKATV